MPRNEPVNILRFYFTQCAIGFGAAAVFVAALLWLDIGHLGTLIAGSDVGWLAVLMLWVFNGIVFAGVQFGVRVMAMAERDDDTRGGGHLTAALMPQPIDKG